ncbi:HECT-like ubiquitin-conjugating enzyme-binding-domain-containing protein [Flammula alnicola]|nr:HECT-like ubiquitin-conjugating enzyme-binding-domain-containing protein [Flammula alnicola]
MATLTRPKTNTRPVSNPFLDSEIPSPFPREQLAQYDSDQRPAAEVGASSEIIAGPSTSLEETPESSNTVALKDVLPSIVYVQKSSSFNAIFTNHGFHGPSRRATSTSALYTLVTNLRNHEANGEILEARESATDAELLGELHLRVEKMSSSLSMSDASLAKALVSLLSDLNRLSDIQANITHLPSQGLIEETSSILEAPPPIDVFDTLTRQLSDLQIQRLSSQAGITVPGASPLLAVETALLWSRVDSELDNVVAMCKQRTETLPKFVHDHLPPQYDIAAYDDLENPPDYELGGRASFDDSKSKAGHQQATTSRQGDEKMRLDLEAVTMAIDRLYLVAPQLHNQRVELKSSKLAQMEKARREGSEPGPSQRTTQGKGKERDFRELENLLDLIGKASERTLKDQSVVLDGAMHARLLERARQRESVKLARHSEAGRIHGQDAVLQIRVKDPEAMLTLPEFMRESLPASERTRDAEALLTLPEFVREAVPAHISQADMELEFPLPDIPTRKSEEKRHRSLSAPPLAWLRSSSSRSSNSSHSSNSAAVSKGKSKAKQSHGFDIFYVAENHENLHHILVFFTVTGTKVVADVQAEILPPFPDPSLDGGDHLVINHTWRDLPSEHWEELVEAWMCHSDQKLHDQVQKYSKGGFWPSSGQGLVGGSYILFDESAMNENNLHVAKDSKHNDNWRLTRCLCGPSWAGVKSELWIRATRRYTGFSSTLFVPPLRIPLSAFIVEDMTEFVQAHASYRFVIQDEEEEKPRILIWLFKPRIRLAYTTPRSHAIPKSANILAAKVLYKLIKPNENDVDIKSILNRYPGFPQAEYLSYPMPICRRLAGLLKESNSAYPESLRTMTGLEVGWLQRV